MAIASAVFLLPFYLNFVGGLGRRRRLDDGAVAGLDGAAATLHRRRGHYWCAPVNPLWAGLMTFGYYAISTLAVGTTPIAVILRGAAVGGDGFFLQPQQQRPDGGRAAPTLGVASGIASMVRPLAQITGIALVTGFHLAGAGLRWSRYHSGYG